jgi:integrase
VSTQPANMDVVRYILSLEDDESMRWQDPCIETRKDVSRPYYFIRPTVPIVTDHGIERKQRPVALGFCDEMTMRQAKAKKQDVMATVNQGKFVAQAQLPFSALLEKFRTAHVPTLSAATRQTYTAHLDNHIGPDLGTMRACDFDVPVLQAWFLGKRDSGLSYWTVKDLRKILSAVFEKSREWKLFTGDNPCRGAAVGPKADKRVKKLVATEDIPRLLAMLPEALRRMVMLCIATGLRSCEVLALTWADVDLGTGTVTPRRRDYRGDVSETLKTEGTKHPRQVGAYADDLKRAYTGPRARDKRIIADAKHPDGWCYESAHWWIERSAKTLGIHFPGFGFHSFRRANITWKQTQGGATPFEAMIGAGKRSIQSTMDYFVMDTDRETAQVNRMLDAITGGEAQKV